MSKQISVIRSDIENHRESLRASAKQTQNQIKKLASFNGAEFLFNRHPEIQELTLHLGTAAGSDIETIEDGGIAAEVFAAVTPQNNHKLANDIEKVPNIAMCSS